MQSNGGREDCATTSPPPILGLRNHCTLKSPLAVDGVKKQAEAAEGDDAVAEHKWDGQWAGAAMEEEEQRQAAKRSEHKDSECNLREPRDAGIIGSVGEDHNAAGGDAAMGNREGRGRQRRAFQPDDDHGNSA